LDVSTKNAFVRFHLCFWYWSGIYLCNRLGLESMRKMWITHTLPQQNYYFPPKESVIASTLIHTVISIRCTSSFYMLYTTKAYTRTERECILLLKYHCQKMMHF